MPPRKPRHMAFRIFPRAVHVSICGTLLMALILPSPTSAQTKSQSPSLELQTLEDFHAAGLMVARKPVTEADEGYRAKIEKHQKTAQAAGDLKGVLAAKQAIADLDASRPPVSDDPGLAAIQKAYLALRQKAVAASEQALAKIEQDYLASLKKLVADLTKSGHIEEAMKAQAKVDALTALPETKTAPAQAAVVAQEIEIWKKKAQEEFPAIKEPASPLAKQMKTLMEKKKLTPKFFKNPQWPYLLAQEASLSLQPLSPSTTSATSDPSGNNSLEKFEGKWTIHFENDWTHKYSIDKAGNVEILQVANRKTSQENTGYGTLKLYIHNSDVLMNLLPKSKTHRMRLVGKKLHVEYWNSFSDYFEGKQPNTQGVSLEEATQAKPTSSSDMALHPQWLPTKLDSKKLYAENLEYFCSKVVNGDRNAPDVVPDKIWSGITWLIPLEQAIAMLPKGGAKT